jgi:hypothetical protein
VKVHPWKWKEMGNTKNTTVGKNIIQVLLDVFKHPSPYRGHNSAKS